MTNPTGNPKGNQATVDSKTRDDTSPRVQQDKIDRKPAACDWQRVVVRDKDWKFTRSIVLAEVDKAYDRAVGRYANEKKRPSALRINAAFRKLFDSVTVWGEKPEVIVEFDSSDDSERPSFLFVYG